MKNKISTLLIITLTTCFLGITGTFAAAEQYSDGDVTGDWKLVEEITGKKSLKYKDSADKRLKLELDKKFTMTDNGEVIRSGFFTVKNNTLYHKKTRSDSGKPLFKIVKASFLGLELESGGTIFKFNMSTWNVKLPGVWKVIGIRKKGKYYKMKKDAKERLFFFGAKGAFKWTENGKPVRSGFYRKLIGQVFYKEKPKDTGIHYLSIRHYYGNVMFIRLNGASIDFVLQKIKS